MPDPRHTKACRAIGSGNLEYGVCFFGIRRHIDERAGLYLDINVDFYNSELN